MGNAGKRSNFEYLRSFKWGICIGLELVIDYVSIGIQQNNLLKTIESLNKVGKCGQKVKLRIPQKF